MVHQFVREMKLVVMSKGSNYIACFEVVLLHGPI